MLTSHTKIIESADGLPSLTLLSSKSAKPGGVPILTLRPVLPKNNNASSGGKANATQGPKDAGMAFHARRYGEWDGKCGVRIPALMQQITRPGTLPLPGCGDIVPLSAGPKISHMRDITDLLEGGSPTDGLAHGSALGVYYGLELLK